MSLSLSSLSRGKARLNVVQIEISWRVFILLLITSKIITLCFSNQDKCVMQLQFILLLKLDANLTVNMRDMQSFFRLKCNYPTLYNKQ